MGLGSQAQHYIFTPEISKKAPTRAWERKAATPFAPRTESHKIWKRCAQTLGQCSDTHVNTMCREKERWRSVKRMRVGDVYHGNENGDDDWDEGFIGTKYQDLGDVEVGKRRKFVTGDSCGGVCFAEANARRSSPPGLGEEEKNPKIPNRQDGKYEGDLSTPYDDNQQTTPLTSLTENDIRPNVMSFDAVLDGNASPKSARRNGRTRSSVVQDVAKAAELETESLNISSLPESDDTEYLHAFLTRAKAKKAAMTILSPEKQPITSAASSPQTRSRTALATLDGNSPSPKMIGKLETPAKRLELDATAMSSMKTRSPQRKSSRTRLPRPQRHQPTTPNSIPVRRSNGTEFVFLQKTEAQQISIATRSNTRRNKGEALRPKMKLEALSSQLQPSPLKAARKRNINKQVSWDEGLAYFAPEELQPTTTEEAEEQAEPTTPVKRSKRLVPGRGTPAPKKKMAEATAVDVGTPLARTRRRTRVKT